MRDRLRAYLKSILDLCIVIVSYYLAYLVRFEGDILREEEVFFSAFPIFIMCFILCNTFFQLSRGIWRYVGMRDIQNIGFFVLMYNAISVLITFILLRDIAAKISRSVILLNTTFSFIGLLGARILYRWLWENYLGKKQKVELLWLERPSQKIVIIGDGDKAFSLQADILKSYPSLFKIEGFITKDKSKVGNRIDTIPIIGTVDDLESIAQDIKIDSAFIALDDYTNQEIRILMQKLHALNIEARIIPTLIDILDKNVSLNDLRRVSFNDYLRRKPVKFDLDKFNLFFKDKTVFISGGAGSIGRELCKLILNFHPQKIIVFDRAETELYRLERENDYYNKYGVEIVYILGDIRDKILLEKVFQENKINYVIHTAALKHVPLSEKNLYECFSVNICGTINMAEVSLKSEVEKFMFISTDKAVEPISFMGKTKRIGELLMKYFNSISPRTCFISVRFGNVIGSSGNVIETFIKQIEDNLPITITHPEMERFFMSVEEASALILESLFLGKGGEIFVLDMGQPIKIKDLAKEIGLFYGKNIKEDDFIYIGIRGKEKLKEKLFFEYEDKLKTTHPKIHMAMSRENNIEDILHTMRDLCHNKFCEEYKIKEVFSRIFSEEINNV